MIRNIMVLFLASLLLLAGNVFAFDPLFDARIDYGAGYDPSSVFAVDLEGDGDNDLAVANAYSDNVSVLMNIDTTGTFQAAVNSEAGDLPVSVFAVDLDGDGDNDLAVANYYSDNVSILLNNGDGPFWRPLITGPGVIQLQFSRLTSMAMATMTWPWLMVILTMSQS